MTQSKRQMLHEILGQLGDGKIHLATYHAIMRDKGLTEKDVDDYLAGRLK